MVYKTFLAIVTNLNKQKLKKQQQQQKKQFGLPTQYVTIYHKPQMIFHAENALWTKTLHCGFWILLYARHMNVTCWYYR